MKSFGFVLVFTFASTLVLAQGQHGITFGAGMIASKTVRTNGEATFSYSLQGTYMLTLDDVNYRIGLGFDQRGVSSLPGFTLNSISIINSFDLNLTDNFYLLLGLKPTYHFSRTYREVIPGQGEVENNSEPATLFDLYLMAGVQQDFQLDKKTKLGAQLVLEKVLVFDSSVATNTDFFNVTFSIVARYDISY